MKLKLKEYKKYIEENWQLFLFPLTFICLYYLANILWDFYNLPSQDQIINVVQTFFTTYGLWVIFLSAIFESMLFVGWYFPGSLVIFLGVSATNGNPILAVKTILAVCFGMLIGYTFNFFLGKYGWHKVLMRYGFKSELEKIEKRVNNRGMVGAFFFYIIPGMGSLLSTAFGILKFNFFKYISFTFLMVVFWNSLWGVIVYYFGMPVFKLLSSGVFVFIAFTAYVYYLHTQGKLTKITAPNV